MPQKNRQKLFTTAIYLLSVLLVSFLFPYPTIASKITISCPHGHIPFKVELAQTPQEQAKGLMHRERLGEDEGMLFLFPKSHHAVMWMKNTPLSLDMVFMDREGRILAIEENTTPYSLKQIGPIENAVQVLELRAGTARKHDISKACSLRLTD